MYTEVTHPQLGPVRITNQAVKMSETNPYVRGCAPLLGEHNDEVYQSLGFTPEEISAWRERALSELPLLQISACPRPGSWDGTGQNRTGGAALRMHSRVRSASFYVPFQLCTGPALCSHRRLLDRMDRNCAAQGR